MPSQTASDRFAKVRCSGSLLNMGSYFRHAVFVFLICVAPLRGADVVEPLRIYSVVRAGFGTQGQMRRSINFKNAKKFRVSKMRRFFGISDGFPEAIVNDLTESRDGTIWMATEFGLYSYDGHEVKHFDTGTLQNISCVRRIDRSGSEEIYVGATTGLGIVSLDRQQITFVERLKGIAVRCINFDHLSRTQVLTEHGLLVQTGEEFTEVNKLTDEMTLNWLESDSNSETTWVGTQSGLYTLTDLKLQPYPVADLDDLPIQKMHEDMNGALWLGTDRSLIRLREGKTVTVRSSPTPIPDYTRSLVSLGTGVKAYLATESVLVPEAELDADVPNRRVWKVSSPPTCSLSDRNGNLWLGRHGEK